MRKLASIQKIVSITPIPGADQIVCATVLGWECVIKKDDGLKVGDLCVYFEIDSILPYDNSNFAFMEPRRYRVKTIKLKKQISQGLIMPLNILPKSVSPEEGLDVTEVLKVTKHEVGEKQEHEPLNTMLTRKHGKFFGYLLRWTVLRRLYNKYFKDYGSWPAWVDQTDEERLQNKPSVLERWQYDYFYVTEKIDYQSATFFVRTIRFLGIFKRRIFGVCSRNVWKKVPDNGLFWQVAKKYNLEKILRAQRDDLTIQGEQGSTNVQKNKYELKGPEFWVFNIINNKTGYHFSLNEMEDFCLKHDLKFVPVIDRAFKLKPTVKEMVEYSRGKSVINPKIQREGFVIRLIRSGKKLQSFKVINPDFLLKYDNGSEDDES